MSEETVTKSAPETDGDVKTWKRRGLFAAAAALIAGVVGNVTEQPVEAGTDGDVILGQANATPGATIITNTTPNSVALIALNNTLPTHADPLGIAGQGLHGEGSGWGVVGFSFINGNGTPGTGGVYGATNRADAYGVLGWNDGGIGVVGQTVGDVQIQNASIGVYGANLSSYAGPSPGAGGFGVYGISSKGHGVVGAAVTAGGAAVVGATNTVAGAYAGVFYGPVVVGGDFTVFGAKSAAVPHPDGSHRRLYCMESPESWFEDFGEQQLECGQAEVTLDPDFAAVVNPEHYQVFLTQYGGHDDLSVVERTPRGFRVEAREATSAARFGWRTVAKRKDIVGERLAAVTIPPAPQLPPVPSPDDAHVPPDIRSRMVRQ